MRDLFKIALEFQNKGDLIKAKNVYSKILRTSDKNNYVLINLALIEKKLEKYSKAINLLQKSIQINPNVIEAHINLGNIFQLLNNHNKAIDYYKNALNINKNFEGIYFNLGNSYMSLEKFTEAATNYKKSIEINPKFYRSFNNLGLLERINENYEFAVDNYKKSISINPNYIHAHYNLMEILEKMHEHDRLKLSINEAKNIFGDHPIVLMFQSLILINSKKFDEAISLLKSVKLQSYKGITYEQKARYYELLGKSYDQKNKAKMAFKYFNLANKIDFNHPENKKFDKDNTLKQIRINRKYFNKKNIKTWKKITQKSNQPKNYFLIGFPRSGTTLLDTILRTHSQIDLIEDKPIVPEIKILFNKKMKGQYEQINKNDLEKIQNLYYDRINFYKKNKSSKKIIIDKMPNNSIEVGFLHRIFPRSKFIFSLRHPCDCVLSCFINRFKMNDAMLNFTTIQDSVNFYNQIMSLWKLYKSNLPIDYFEIKYENLVLDLKKNITPLLGFLELDWEDSLFDFNKTALSRKKINTPSYNQVTKPLYKQAINRWQRYDKFLKIEKKLLKWINEFEYN